MVCVENQANIKDLGYARVRNSTGQNVKKICGVTQRRIKRNRILMIPKSVVVRDKSPETWPST